MRAWWFRLLGSAALLASCSVQPAVRDATNARDVQVPALFAPRFSVEFVTAENRDAASEPRAERVTGGPRRPLDRRLPGGGEEREKPSNPWEMSKRQLAAIDDPFERLAISLGQKIMGEDHRRVRREFGTPMLRPSASDQLGPGIELPSDAVQADEESTWQAENGMRLLNRPLKRMLKELPIGETFDASLEQFKADVPLSEEYNEARENGRRRRSTRVSMRVRVTNLDNPAELTLIQSGFRLGSNLETLKLGYGGDLAKDVTLGVHCRYGYEADHFDTRLDLAWKISATTTLHLVGGNNMDFIDSSSAYSLFESPMDGSTGLLLCGVHLF